MLSDFQQIRPGMYKCTVCPSPLPLQAKRIPRHEQGHTHKQAVRRQEKRMADLPQELGSAGPSTTPYLSPTAVRGPLSQMLDEIQSTPHAQWDTQWLDADSGVASGVDWESVVIDTQMQHSLDAHIMAEMAEKTRQYLLHPEGIDQDSGSDVDERPSSESSSEDHGSEYITSYPCGLYYCNIAFTHLFSAQSSQRSKRKVTDNPDTPYFPWPDREVCYCFQNANMNINTLYLTVDMCS